MILFCHLERSRKVFRFLGYARNDTGGAITLRSVAVASSILRVRLKQNDINKVLLRTAPAAEEHADRLTKHIRRQRLKGSLASPPLPSLSFLLRSTNISPLDESS